MKWLNDYGPTLIFVTLIVSSSATAVYFNGW